MRITIEGASPEFERKLLDLLAEHREELTVTVDTTWTVERAVDFLRSLTAAARLFARLVVDADDGLLGAHTLREHFDRGLRGPTVSLAKALTRGMREGWLPEGIEAPIAVVYGGPASASWRRADSYRLTSENVPVFREAFARLDAAPARLNWAAGEAPSAFAPAQHPAWGKKLIPPEGAPHLPFGRGRSVPRGSSPELHD
ncbi:hypothetical protein OKJ48_20530 [Streptomyces kunmingensis]|uniref:Uncharacterized protein n=1 Tax=Streptomyces kunmingensis TaxID=68225 RepID=A0ABU6CD26_9ACTN|nr:hypothetical protein [Streptomyces kunmingensis]MEB3962619.1 hypothetical protein [Streptomyces kunmingensis]